MTNQRAILVARLNSFTGRAPLRYKVAVVQALRALDRGLPFNSKAGLVTEK